MVEKFPNFWQKFLGISKFWKPPGKISEQIQRFEGIFLARDLNNTACKIHIIAISTHYFEVS